MQKIIGILIIIILFPTIVVAQSEGRFATFQVEADVVPGEPNYTFERLREWFELNILTIGTTDKQQKNLELAEERLAEFVRLINRGRDVNNLDFAIERYERFISQAEGMAEVIIFLDGAEINLADQFEAATRNHELVLLELATLKAHTPEIQARLNNFLSVVRGNNQNMFEYMVQNYQFDETDIQKHQAIVQNHIDLLIDFARDNRVSTRAINGFVGQAREHRGAGLNLEAYGFADQAKVRFYSDFFSISP